MSYPTCLLTLQKQQICDDLPQTTINKAINDFRKRLNACVSANRGHFLTYCVNYAVALNMAKVPAARLLRTRPTFSRSVMVSVGVSALGRTSIHFVEPGVKVNGQYYRNILLLRGLLPEIRELSEYFIFQQDSAPAHRARETVKLLKAETPDFIPPTLWPPNSPDLNPVDYKVWPIMQEKVYQHRINDIDELRQCIVSA